MDEGCIEFCSVDDSIYLMFLFVDGFDVIFCYFVDIWFDYIDVWFLNSL